MVLEIKPFIRAPVHYSEERIDEGLVNEEKCSDRSPPLSISCYLKHSHC